MKKIGLLISILFISTVYGQSPLIVLDANKLGLNIKPRLKNNSIIPKIKSIIAPDLL